MSTASNTEWLFYRTYRDFKFIANKAPTLWGTAENELSWIHINDIFMDVSNVSDDSQVVVYKVSIWSETFYTHYIGCFESTIKQNISAADWYLGLSGTDFYLTLEMLAWRSRSHFWYVIVTVATHTCHNGCWANM